MQQTANPGISYVDGASGGEVRILCDSRQVSQALTNLLLNATDSVKERLAGGNGGNPGEGGGEIPSRHVQPRAQRKEMGVACLLRNDVELR